MLKGYYTKVVKFGGSSLADAGMIKRAADIIRSDKARRYVIPSAPGKRHDGDIKVTDLLINWHSAVSKKENSEQIFPAIEKRFIDIVADLEIEYDIKGELDEIKRRVLDGAGRDFAVSRGEYLCGNILARYLGYEFIDPTGLILFDDDGIFLPEETNEMLSKRLSGVQNAVISGFYGSTPDGEIKTFTRGGSDITGAIVARAVDADLYENWTDVSGFLMCDPRIVDGPEAIKTLNYDELRELSHMGAAVMHDEAVFPLKAADIPVNILNTFSPTDSGTLIIPPCCILPPQSEVTGIAGIKNMAAVSICKSMMQPSFYQKAFGLLCELGIKFHTLPSGTDKICVAVDGKDIEGREGQLLRAIKKELSPDGVEIESGVALISVVGRGMVGDSGAVSRILAAAERHGINIRFIEQSIGGLSITIGVNESAFTDTVKAIYDEFKT